VTKEIGEEMPHQSFGHIPDHVSGNARDFSSPDFVCDHAQLIE
jgi:hypothetical protein